MQNYFTYGHTGSKRTVTEEISIVIGILYAEAIIYSSHLIQAILFRNFKIIHRCHMMPFQSGCFHLEATTVLSVFTDVRKH